MAVSYYIAKNYAKLIHKGVKTINDVPETPPELREEVLRILEEEFDE